MGKIISDNGFEMSFSFAAWVPPERLKKENKCEIESTILDQENKAFPYFLKIFDRAIDKCKIEIQFQSPDQNQQNPVRSNILAILSTTNKDEKLQISKGLAERLASVTDDRSGNSLFLIMEGCKLQTARILLSRFRADEAVFTRHASQKLVVDFIQESFNKRSQYYKAAVFEDVVNVRSFWCGYAIDKQIMTTSSKEISSYWITDFLQARSAITNTQGTMHLAKVMRTFLHKNDDLAEKEQVISALLGLKHRKTQPVSLETICNNYLSPELSAKIKTIVADDYYFSSFFSVDDDIYRKELGNLVLELSNGLNIIAPTFKYKEYIKEEHLPSGDTQISVVGTLKDKKIAKEKAKSKNG